MLAKWLSSELRDKWRGLSHREQWMVALVLGAAIYLLVDALVFTPQTRREKALQDSQQQLQSQLVVLAADMAAVDKTRVDNLAKAQAEHALIKQQAAELEGLVQSVSLDEPKIKGLMAGMLGSKSSRVKVAAIKTLPVKPLAAAAKAPAAGAAPASGPPKVLSAGSVYKHGLEIELRGSYLDLMAFLTSMEEANPRLLWSNATLTAGTYPENTLRVSVFLLSTQANL